MEDFKNFLCFQMGSAARKIQKFYNHMYRRYGTTLGQSFILFALLEKDGQNLGTLAEQLDLDNSALTGLVDRMEKELLVERRVDPGDRRAYKIYLTPKGYDLAREIYQVAYKFNQDLRKALGQDEQKALGMVFSKIHQVVG